MSLISRLILIAVLIVVLVGFMATSDPQSLDLGLILAPFVLFGAIVFNIIRFLMSLFRYQPQNQAKQRIIASIFAIIFTNFAVLQSIGRLTPQDLIIALTITVIVTVYVGRFQIPSK